MTSDAKIGLLVGLVFIFVIAFIINGLPSLQRDKNNNELTTNMINSHRGSPGIGVKERVVIEQSQQQGRQPFGQVQRLSTDVEGTRLTMELPKSVAVSGDTSEGKAVAEAAAEATVEKKEPLPEEKAPEVVKKEEAEVQKSSRSLARVYTVAEGDNLASVAQKFYGEEEGNKRANIAKIFEANRDRLDSEDRISPGQKRLIPPLKAAEDSNRELRKTFGSKIFEAVESIGRRHLPNGGSQTEAKRQYVVQEEDNLWKIAVQCLGDGSRYKEIVKLNADILDDEDEIVVGMRLKIPDG
jgi:nucleoid-associated protein YgaU